MKERGAIRITQATVALILSLPISVIAGYHFAPPSLVVLLAFSALALAFLIEPAERLTNRWRDRSLVKNIAADVVLPLIGFAILHLGAFFAGLMMALASDLSI